MKTIRRFAYAAVLTLSALNFTPSLAFAQDAAGTFTLTHEVHWQNAVVPAGKKYLPEGGHRAPGLPFLHQKTGAGAGVFFIVTGNQAPPPSDPSPPLVGSPPQ